MIFPSVFEMIFPLRTRCIFGSLDCCQASAECCVIHACNWELSVKGANPDAMRRLATTKSTEYFKTMTHRFEIFRHIVLKYSVDFVVARSLLDTKVDDDRLVLVVVT
jgi:hypothetical protein